MQVSRASRLGGDDGLNATQAAIAEDAARMAIREVLAHTRSIAAAVPALEVHHRTLRPVKSASSGERPSPPDIIA